MQDRTKVAIDKLMLDPASLGADEGGGSTGEFICVAATETGDSVEVVAMHFLTLYRRGGG